MRFQQGCENTHKGIPHLHSALVCLLRTGPDAEISGDGSKNNPQHHLRQVLSAADSGAHSKWYHMLGHSKVRQTYTVSQEDP